MQTCNHNIVLGVDTMGNIETLVSFKKGQSGNPNGRPKGVKNIKTYLTNALDCKLEYENEVLPVKQIIALKLIKTALDSNRPRLQLDAIREILDRTLGKPIQGTLTLDLELLDNDKLKELFGNSFEVIE